jgi:hypothetical protein
MKKAPNDLLFRDLGVFSVCLEETASADLTKARRSTQALGAPFELRLLHQGSSFRQEQTEE